MMLTSSQWKVVKGSVFEAGCIVEVIQDDGSARTPPIIGRLVNDYSDGERYIETFAGLRLRAPEDDQLRKPVLMTSDQGGVDLFFPAADNREEFSAFAKLFIEGFRSEHACLIQAFSLPEQQAGIAAFVEQNSERFEQPRKEIRQDILGRDPFCKALLLQSPDLENSGISLLFSTFSELQFLFYSFGAEELGLRVSLGQWLLPLLRCPLAGKYEAQCLDSGCIRQEDVQVGMVEHHIRFLKTRRLLFLYLVCGSGTVELCSRCGVSKAKKYSLPANRLLIVDEHHWSWTVKLDGDETIALQAWVGSEVDTSEVTVQELRGPLAEDDVVSLPNGPGFLTMVSSLACRMAGCDNPDQAWNCFLANIDGYVEIPKLRFDVDAYYADDGRYGSIRTRHSAMVEDKHFLSFDNEFFGWSSEFTAKSSMLCRLAIDVGYDCILRAGLTKKDAFGKRIGFYCGHNGDFEANIGYSPPTMLSYFLGTTGPASIVDTACSSSLVGMNLAHQDCCLGRADGLVVGGVNALTDVNPFIAMSSGRMLASRGRSRTFDHSADGYGRGEGIAALFLEPAGENPMRLGLQEPPTEWCRVAGSNNNQDGRSASITAPSGPAQTACIMACLREAGLSPADISFGECHGTGTALGDPIEVGSSRMVMETVKRSTPYLFGAVKSNVGHLELGAGSAGSFKVVLLLNHAVGPSNCHFYQLNDHFSVEGFPVIMPTESMLFTEARTFAGVCSFGFGGTNARSELVSVRKGFAPEAGKENRPLDPSPILCTISHCVSCQGTMCWLCAMAIPNNEKLLRGQHVCASLRKDTDDYSVCSNCFTGSYSFGFPHYQDSLNPHRTVYVVGSWSDWSNLEEIEVGLDGCYEFQVTIGNHVSERFHFVLDADAAKTLQPVYDDANEFARIAGPDYGIPRKNWLIDGRLDGARPGSVYTVRFDWKTTGKSISWKMVE